MKRTLVAISLLLLAVGQILSLYYLCFFVWMTAYQTTNLDAWRVRVYIWLAISVVIGLFWVTLVAWLFRRRRRNAT